MNEDNANWLSSMLTALAIVGAIIIGVLYFNDAFEPNGNSAVSELSPPADKNAPAPTQPQ